MSPHDLAREFALVESTNILAHSIRKIEDKIFNMARDNDIGFNYHISIRINEEVAKSNCIFAERGCTIFLPKQENDIPSPDEIKNLRLCLAHELGHIALHLEHILDPDEMKKYYGDKNIQEEADAWEFAYELIKSKSDFYKGNPGHPYIYADESQIGAAIVGALSRNNTERNLEIIAELRKRKFPHA